MSWQLEGMEARLRHDEQVVRLEIDRPQRGMHVESVLGEAAPAVRPLGFTATPVARDGRERILEAYVRGADLMVRYDELPHRDVRLSAEWRVLDLGSPPAAIELRLAMQTRWLQSHPEVDLCTEYPASATMWRLVDGEWRRVSEQERQWGPEAGPGAFLFRIADRELTYGELVYPSDYHGVERDIEDGTVRLKYRFFAEPLEKGVVRVARIWSIWLPRQGDQRLAARLYRRLVESELPLTA